MITSKSYQTSSLAKSESITIAKTSVLSRTAYIDILRFILIILVIAVHAAVTYGSIGDWTYEDPRQDELSGIVLSFLVFYSQAFFMALLFFFAGYFTPGSVDRKDWGGFWKDRFLRLGLPLIAYTWFLGSIPNYIDAAANESYHLGFWNFFKYYFMHPDEGPTWFLFVLLVFSLGYFICREAGKRLLVNNTWMKKLAAPGNLTLITAAAFLSISLFLVAQFISMDKAVDIFGIFSMKLTFFPSYILFFIAGIFAFRSNWMEQFDMKVQRFWNWMSLGLVIALPILLLGGGAADGKINLFLGGRNIWAFLTSTWLSFTCISFSVSLTLWLRNRTASTSKLAAVVGKTNFGAYFIHPLILVPVTLAISFITLPGLLKFVIATVLTVPLTYILADVLRRIPGLNRIF
jgi:glucans biosynthesis protein C